MLPYDSVNRIPRGCGPGRATRGFTMIELLTVAAVCCIALALVVPGIQQARMDARDTHCRRNLKAIGLAAHNYHDVYGMFPVGWVSRDPDGPGHASLGWIPRLTPFLDQLRVYEAVDMETGVFGHRDNSAAVLSTPIPEIRCPLDVLADTNPYRGDLGTSNYVGNYGSLPIPRWSEVTEFWPGQVRSDVSRDIKKDQLPNGMFLMNQGVKIRHVIDGTSNTLLVGERDTRGQAAIWPGVRSNYHESDCLADGHFSSPLNRSVFGYTSRHGGGNLMFCLTDGSVRPINEQISSTPETAGPDSGILQKLSNRNDGQIIRSF